VISEGTVDELKFRLKLNPIKIQLI